MVVGETGPSKAVIAMAGVSHEDMPLQRVTRGDGQAEHVTAVQIRELLEAGIEQVALVVRPASLPLLQPIFAEFGRSLVVIEQPSPDGFGDAVLRTEQWIGKEPFVLQVCDHVFLSREDQSATAQLIDVARRERCCVSGVRATNEALLPYFGIVSGQRVKGHESLYQVDGVLEKPSPTRAEECCRVAGVRWGIYLGFFGIHVLAPTVFPALHEERARLAPGEKLGLSEALNVLAGREKYLALEVAGHRVDLEGPFGLLRAQLAIALRGPRRDEVLSLMLEETAQALSGNNGLAKG